MKVKSEKGYTGIDVAISIIVLFIFISLIAILSYQFNHSAKEIKLKSEAVKIAVEEMEKIKTVNFLEIESKIQETKEIEGKEGFYKTIIVEDYADLKENKTPGVVKKVTVQIQYTLHAKDTEMVELSTIVAKER